MKFIFILGILVILTACAGLKTSPPIHQEFLNDKSFPSLVPQLPDLSSWTLQKLTADPGWNLPTNFLTKNGALWKELEGAIPSYRKVILWKKIQENASDPVEHFWASLGLYREYARAELTDEAIDQLKLAFQDFDLPLVRLEWAWQLFFKKQDQSSAGKLLKGLNRQDFSGEALSRWNFLDLGRHFHWLDWGKSPMDLQISDLQVDHDDLWISTWNGALGRYSLVTGEFTQLLQASTAISPIRLIRLSRYFVYVFRDNRIQRYSKVTGRWKEFELPSDWSGLRVQDVVLTGEDSFFAAHLGRGLWSWKEGQWSDLSKEIPSLFLNALLRRPSQENTGEWLVGTQDQGVLNYSEGQGVRPWPSSGKAPHNITFLRTHQGQVLAGTFGQGLWKIAEDKAEKLADQGFVVCGNSSGDDFWWGTLDDGLQKNWGSSRMSWSVEQGLPQRDVMVMAQWKNEFFLGMTGQGVGVWSDED